MKTHLVVATVLLLLAGGVASGASQPPSRTIRLFMGEQRSNPLVQYRVDLIQAAMLAVGVRAEVRGCERLDRRSSDRRSAIAVMDEQACDLIATSAGSELTREMAVVPFPIYLGGGGYRVLLMTPESLRRVPARALDIDTLRRLRVGSGSSWADTRIMERNQIPLERSAVYERLFSMLRADRFDAMSRSIFEVDAELQGIAADGFVLEPNTLVHYSTDLFFYVAASNQALQAQLLSGLQRMYCKGQMQRFLRSHPATRGMWARVRPQARSMLELDTAGLIGEQEAAALALYKDDWKKPAGPAPGCETRP